MPLQLTAEDATQIAKYVATTDKVLTKQASLEAAIPAAVDALVDVGVIGKDARTAKLAEFCADPTKLIGVLTKAAKSMPSMGSPAAPARPEGAPKRSAADLAYEARLQE